jgi:hypothetical protein
LGAHDAISIESTTASTARVENHLRIVFLSSLGKCKVIKRKTC